MALKFHADDYFHIGHMHLIAGKPCQDYSFSGVYGDAALAVVSDGCSTGRHTDVGARIIALAAVNALKQWSMDKAVPLDKIDKLITRQHNIAVTKSMDAFGLELEDMLATCAYALLTASGGIINFTGDGVMAKVYSNGTIRLTSYRWANNAPLYPAYAADEYKSFIEYHGGKADLPALELEHRFFVSRDKIYVPSAPYFESISIENAIAGVTNIIPASEIKDLSFAAVFTDGVMQVEDLSWYDAALELMAFKSLEGEFAKRRMIRFIKDSKRDGKKGPLDDIAYSVVRIEPESAKEG